jgi:hypothetical protein
MAAIPRGTPAISRREADRGSCRPVADDTYERERDKVPRGQRLSVRAAVAPPMESFSDTREQAAASETRGLDGGQMSIDYYLRKLTSARSCNAEAPAASSRPTLGASDSCTLIRQLAKKVDFQSGIVQRAHREARRSSELGRHQDFTAPPSAHGTRRASVDIAAAM